MCNTYLLRATSRAQHHDILILYDTFIDTYILHTISPDIINTSIDVGTGIEHNFIYIEL